MIRQTGKMDVSEQSLRAHVSSCEAIDSIPGIRHGRRPIYNGEHDSLSGLDMFYRWFSGYDQQSTISRS